MIGYIEGTLIWSTTNLIILSVNGLGYEVYFHNNFTHSDYGLIKKVFISHKISEYGETLYGFESIEEKLIFENLENIKGVGSKVIYTIMSELVIKSASDLPSISLDSLVKLPGVGKSTAQKFLLGLSNKLKKEFDLESLKSETSDELEKKYKNEIELLVEWGMRKSDLVAFIKDNQSSLADMNSDQLIQTILKSFKKK